MYTVWKILLVLALNGGDVEQRLTFEEPRQCYEAQRMLSEAGLNVADCEAVSVWAAAGPDGYNAYTGEYE